MQRLIKFITVTSGFWYIDLSRTRVASHTGTISVSRNQHKLQKTAFEFERIRFLGVEPDPRRTYFYVRLLINMSTDLDYWKEEVEAPNMKELFASPSY